MSSFSFGGFGPAAALGRALSSGGGVQTLRSRSDGRVIRSRASDQPLTTRVA